MTTLNHRTLTTNHLRVLRRSPWTRVPDGSCERPQWVICRTRHVWYSTWRPVLVGRSIGGSVQSYVNRSTEWGRIPSSSSTRLMTRGCESDGSVSGTEGLLFKWRPAGLVVRDRFRVLLWQMMWGLFTTLGPEGTRLTSCQENLQGYNKKCVLFPEGGKSWWKF